MVLINKAGKRLSYNFFFFFSPMNLTFNTNNKMSFVVSKIKLFGHNLGQGWT